jgi:histone deacetylase 1/2
MDDDAEQQTAGAQVMVAHGGGRGQPTAPGGQAPPRPSANTDPNYISPNYKGKNPIPGYQGRSQGAPPQSRGGGPSQHQGGGGRGRGHPSGGRGYGDTSHGRGGGQEPWIGYFAPMHMPFPPPRAPWIPPNAHGVLGSCPHVATHAYPSIAAPSAPPSIPAAPAPPAPSWDYATMYQNAPSYGSAFAAYGGDWVMDSGASSHVAGSSGILTKSHSPSELTSQHIVVGNGTRLPIVATGTAALTDHPFHLHNVLVSPHIVKNLISTRKFSRDNSVSVEFDPFGFSVKDLTTRRILMRSDSSGDLYPFFSDGGVPPSSALTVTSDLWHRRLGHPSDAALSHLPLEFLSTCNKESTKTSFCDACQLGKQARLPFSVSHSRSTSPFDLIHCNLWTSPIVSYAGYKYYLVIFDDFSHYSWVFPLQNKSDTCDT